MKNGFISTGTAQLWETAGVRVDATHNRLVLGDAERLVEPRVMDVLLVLMQHHGEVVSRDRLIEKVWQGRPISDEAVNRAVFEIRKAFSELGVENAVIRTVRSRGYEWVPDALVHDGHSAGPARGRWAVGVLLVATAAVAIGLALRGSGVESRSAAAGIPALALPPPNSPVIQLAEPDNELPPGIRDTYGVALLGRIERLLSHQNSLIVRRDPAPDTSEDVMQLVLALDSVEGELRLGADLASPAGETIWTDTLRLPEDFSRLASAPERMVSGMMQALGLDYRPREECPMPADATALEDYFEGRRRLALRGESNIRAAIETLENVLQTHPEFSQAWSVLARAYQVLPVYIDGDAGLQERARSGTLATVAARKALAICPSDALAFQIAGATPGYTGSNAWIRNEYRMRYALALDPNDGELARHYSEHLYQLGMYESAYRIRRHAHRVAPGNARIALELAWIEADLGNLERAEELLRAARAQGSDIVFPVMEHNLAAKRQDWTTVERLLTHYPDSIRPAMEAVYRVDRNPGDTAVADAAEAALRSTMAENPEVGNILAHVMGILIGRLDLAFEAYEVMRHDQYNYTSFWSRRFDALRRDPRFEDAVFEMGMREYWERFGDPDFCDLTDGGLSCHT